MTRLTVNELLMLRAAGPLAARQLSATPAARPEQDGAAIAARAPGALARLAGLVARGVARARDRRDVIEQLGRMDDRLLRDIGLERGTLVEAVDAALEKRAPTWALEGALDSLADLGKAIVGPIVRWHRNAVTLGELQQLDDRQLADIGITRGDLRFALTRVIERSDAANDDEASPRRAA